MPSSNSAGRSTALAFVVVASFSGARFVEAVAGWMFAAHWRRE